MKKLTKKQAVEAAVADYNRKAEERRAAREAETAALLAANADVIADLAETFTSALVGCINLVYSTYTPKTPTEFYIEPRCTVHSFGVRVRDTCHNSFDLFAVTEIEAVDRKRDTFEINHSASGSRSLEQVLEFTSGLADITKLGLALKAKLAPIIAIFAASSKLVDADAVDDVAAGAYRYRILEAAAKMASPKVYEYAKFRRLG